LRPSIAALQPAISNFTEASKQIAPMLSNANHAVETISKQIESSEQVISNVNAFVEVAHHGMQGFFVDEQMLARQLSVNLSNLNLFVTESRTNLATLTQVVTKTVVSYKVPKEVWVGIAGLIAALAALFKSRLTAGKKAKLFEVLAQSIDAAKLSPDDVQKLKDAQKKIGVKHQHAINMHLDMLRNPPTSLWRRLL